MRKLRISLFFVLLSAVCSGQQKIQYQLCDEDFSPIYMRHNLPAKAVYTDSTASPAVRAKDVLSRLNFDEKLKLTGGWNGYHFPSVPRLGLRPILTGGSSQGITFGRWGITLPCIAIEKSTSFPCTLALAATWDPELAYVYSEDIGEECQALGYSVLLGPGINMYRNSEGGRNFEYMGEDPFLTSKMVVPYIQGLQGTGTLTTPKHFIGNEQEFLRHVANTKVSERALREIYLPPFLAAINQGGALGIMTGNNFVNGFPGAANKPLSEDILRKEVGFKGIIMSDWANSRYWPSQQNMIIGSGQSLMMPDNQLFAKYVDNEVKQHPESKSRIEKQLDSMVFYNLYTFFKFGFYDRPYRNIALINKVQQHTKTALKTAEEAITLLKNEGQILPINQKAKSIVVVGTTAALKAYVGNGSGKVKGYNVVDYLTGLRNVYGDNKVIHKKSTDAEIKSADIVLYFINKPASENYDYPFDLSDFVNNDIERCSHLNKNIVVVYSGGNGFAMPWINDVKGVVYAYLLGQESGTALANIVSGKVNPSGKLPFTIEKSFKDSPAFDFNKLKDGSYSWWDGDPERKIIEKFKIVEIPYKEGIYIGYRWYDQQKITPQFPFGFGLSYTDFKFSPLKVSSPTIGENKPVTISFSITNTGKVAGAEIAQLYIHAENPAIDRPLKELKGFKRVFLNPGQTKVVNIQVSAQDLAYWAEKENGWKIDPGKYSVGVGSSSVDIKEKSKISYQP